jgi:hypothetical protein
MDLHPTQLDLYEKTAVMGDYQVGELKAPVRHVEVSRNGQSIIVQRWDHTRQELYMLDGDLVAAWYQAPFYNWLIGMAVPPVFDAFSAQQNGKSLVENALPFEALGDCEDQWRIAAGSMQAARPFERWSWSGSCIKAPIRKKKTSARFTATWRWDKARKVYTADWKEQ